MPSKLLHKGGSDFIFIELFDSCCHLSLSSLIKLVAASCAVTLAGANADLLAVDHLDVGTNTLLALRAVESDLASVDSTFGVYYAADLTLSASLVVLVDDVCALNDNLALFGRCSDYLMQQ